MNRHQSCKYEFWTCSTGSNCTGDLRIASASMTVKLDNDTKRSYKSDSEIGLDPHIGCPVSTKGGIPSEDSSTVVD